jgi:hypothetical protein
LWRNCFSSARRYREQKREEENEHTGEKGNSSQWDGNCDRLSEKHSCALFIYVGVRISNKRNRRMKRRRRRRKRRLN